MKPLRVVVLASSDISDIYFANQMLKHLNVVGVAIEQQQVVAKTSFSGRCVNGLKYTLAPWLLFEHFSSARVFREYHSMARRVGLEHFGAEANGLINPPKGCKVIQTVGKNSINAPAHVEEIRKLHPDIIVVCGCSILKKEILSVPPSGTLNLHGGLSQRYRGIWTTMWAVHNGEPEYVGATVHYVSPGIDDGDIVYQGRPEITAEDNSESLYAKVVKLGVRMMVAAVQNIQRGDTTRHPQQEKGQLYLGRMVTADVLKKTMDSIDDCLLARYLREKDQRDEKVIGMMRGKYSPLK